VGDDGDVADILDGHNDTGVGQNLGAEYTPASMTFSSKLKKKAGPSSGKWLSATLSASCRSREGRQHC
ncbi:MAG: hypothetical protein Q8J78_05710, partial [Moraxellaceae bacterium]|nr:hypothetical protein [Moraxellaceae bacterium]